MAALLLVAACSPAADQPEPDAVFLSEYAVWRSERIARLRESDGWLSLVGLHWLENGANRFGSGDDNDIVLPALPALAGQPATLGNLILDPMDGGELTVRLEVAPGAALESADLTETGDFRLRTDRADQPSELILGSLRFGLIERGGEIALRARDLEQAQRSHLAEIPAFEPDPAWRVDARFEPAQSGRTIPIPNIVGRTYDQSSVGTIVFRVAAREYRLDAIGDRLDQPLLLVVGDQTNGQETYGGGRYLYVEVKDDGSVELDLNRLYNPPCVFTAYATCPLPPPQNRLELRIEAGEKNYQKLGWR